MSALHTPGNCIALFKRGLPVALTEIETTELLRLAVSPRFVPLYLYQGHVRLRPHELCEWAFVALDKMREAAVVKVTAEPRTNKFYCCTNCIWLGTLDEATEDSSIAEEGKLCPECFSHIEPSEGEHTGSTS